jgi:predicted MFS family arabinose efflux permease
MTPGGREAPPTHRPSYQWVVLAMAFMGVFGALGFGRFGYSAVLPAMQKGLHISSAAAGSLASWNLIGYTVMSAVGGVLSQRWGPRKVIAVGMVTTAVGMLITGFVHTLAGASGARLLTGMGNGLVLVPSISLMAAWFQARRLGLASTIVPSGSSLALVVVGLAVPPIIHAGGDTGWRLAWYFFAGVTIFFAVLSFFIQRDRPANAVLDGDQEIVLDKYAPPAIRARLSPPSFNLGPVLRSGYAWHLGGVYLLYGVAFLLYFTFFQKRLTVDLKYSSQTAGYLFMLLGIAGLAGGLTWGSVSDRFGRERTLALTLLLAGIGGFLFGTRLGLPVLALSAVLFGSTGLSLPGLMGAACADRFGPKLASASLGLITILVGVGQAVGPLIGGAMNDALSSLAPSYFFSGAVFVVAAFAAWLLPKGSEADGGSSVALPKLPARRRVR